MWNFTQKDKKAAVFRRMGAVLLAACLLLMLVVPAMAADQGASAGTSATSDHAVRVQIPVSMTDRGAEVVLSDSAGNVVRRQTAEDGESFYFRISLNYGDYEYTVRETSTGADHMDEAAYEVRISVFRGDSGADESVVVLNRVGSEQKSEQCRFTNYDDPPEPVTVSDPPIEKAITGDSPSSDAVFLFEFRAVSTTAEGLEGNLPMPEGSDGQTKQLQITGQGRTEAGEITFSETGTYVYEIREINTGVQGYTYDTSVYRITYTVSEGEEGLTCSRLLEKDGVETSAFRAVFTNAYKKTTPSTEPSTRPSTPSNPGTTLGTTPQTGDTTNLVLWILVMAGSALLIILLVISGQSRRKYAEAGRTEQNKQN